MDSFILRYDIIRKIMYRMFNANEKCYDMFSLQKHCNGVANYFEETYGNRLLQGRRSQRILGLELDQPIGELFKKLIPQFLNFKKIIYYIIQMPPRRAATTVTRRRRRTTRRRTTRRRKNRDTLVNPSRSLLPNRFHTKLVYSDFLPKLLQVLVS